MNQAQIQHQLISKTGTPQFGLRLAKQNHDQQLVQNTKKQNEPENNDKNWPEAILEQSSNSSGNNQVLDKNNYNKDQTNADIQLIYVKDQPQLQRKKLKKIQKTKGQTKFILSLTDKNKPMQCDQKQNSKVTSSLGYPAHGESPRKKTVLNQKQAEEDCKIYKSGAWTKTKLMLTEDRLAFFECSFDIKDLEKIKILPSINSSRTRSQNIIKIVANSQINLFSLGLQRKSYEVPTSYFLFSKIIQKKMFQNKLIDLPQWEKSEPSLKRSIEDSYIYGNILKKSQHLGKWQTRFIVIKKTGIYSYKNSSQLQNYSFCVNNQSIKYIWTRFEKIDQFLIIKVKHGIFKTQFAIPLTSYSSRSSNNWLYAFYRTLPIIVPSTSNLV